MKEKHVLVIDEIKICVRSDEPKETIERISDNLNRRLRAIHQGSRNISKVEAAIVASLDLQSENDTLACRLAEAEAEIVSLRRSLEVLKRG